MISVGGTFTIPLGTGEEFDFSPRKASTLRRASTLPLCDYIADEENALLRTLLPSLQRSTNLFGPLLLWGPTSTGKTTLALALVQRAKAIAPEGKLLLLTAADFARAYANAIDTDSLSEFRQRFLQTQLVVIDDLHHLAGKTSALAELRTLLDLMTASSIRVVVTSLHAPSDLPFTADLRGRLSQGLVIPLRWPGASARREIVVRYLASRHATLSEAMVARLADHYCGPPSRLFSGLAQLVHGAEVERRPLDDAYVAESLAAHTEAAISPRAVIAAVAKQFHVTVKDLKGTSRRQAINTARGVAMYLLRHHTKQTFEQIGQHFAGRDHTTVMHACQKTTERLAGDPQLQHAVDQVVTHLQETH